MTATELEIRTLAAEADPSLIRQLITDFKAHKDAQLSDLTGQVNTANAAVTAAIAAITAERDALKQTIADFLAADDAGATEIRKQARKSEKQRKRDAAQAEFDAVKIKLDMAKDALLDATNDALK